MLRDTVCAGLPATLTGHRPVARTGLLRRPDTNRRTGTPPR
ncbi:hypothetical protein QZN11_34290 [Streptomyces gramineus]